MVGRNPSNGIQEGVYERERERDHTLEESNLVTIPGMIPSPFSPSVSSLPSNKVWKSGQDRVQRCGESQYFEYPEILHICSRF